MYPAIIIIMMVAVMVIMMIFVLPQLAVLYQNLNVPLPLPTQIVVGLSNLVVATWPIILAAIAVFAFFYRRWSKTTDGRLIIDTLKLKLPIFGKLMEQSILAEFSRTLGLLVEPELWW